MARKINIIILLLLVGLNSFNTFDKDHKIPGISRKVQSWIDRAHMLSVSKLLTARDDLIRSAVSQLESEEDWNGLFHLYRW